MMRILIGKYVIIIMVIQYLVLVIIMPILIIPPLQIVLGIPSLDFSYQNKYAAHYGQYHSVYDSFYMDEQLWWM